MANHQVLLNKIETQLNTLTKVQEVVVGGGVPTEFPSVALEFDGSTNEERDEVHNEKTYNYSVRTFLEVNPNSELGKDNVESIIATVLDELCDLFDKDNTLGGVCDNVLPTSSSSEYSPIKNGNAKIITVNIQCMVLEYINA